MVGRQWRLLLGLCGVGKESPVSALCFRLEWAYKVWCLCHPERAKEGCL